MVAARNGAHLSEAITVAAANEADMVLELLRAIQQHRTYQPARLSPFTERAYREAESQMLSHVAREAS